MESSRTRQRIFRPYYHIHCVYLVWLNSFITASPLKPRSPSSDTRPNALRPKSLCAVAVATLSLSRAMAAPPRTHLLGLMPAQIRSRIYDYLIQERLEFTKFSKSQKSTQPAELIPPFILLMQKIPHLAREMRLRLFSKSQFAFISSIRKRAILPWVSSRLGILEAHSIGRYWLHPEDPL